MKVEKMANVLQHFGTKRTLVVHCQGLDEMSPLGTLTWTPSNLSRMGVHLSDKLPRVSVRCTTSVCLLSL
jgi:D-alanyl-D-alanine carboxypeptidase